MSERSKNDEIELHSLYGDDKHRDHRRRSAEQGNGFAADVYTQVATKTMRAVISPLDRLALPSSGPAPDG